MKDEKVNRLLRAARNETAPLPGAGLEGRVMTAVRRSGHQEVVSLLDQINLLFPRVAWAAAAVIACCILVEAGVGMFSQSDISAKVAEISEQWIFAAN